MPCIKRQKTGFCWHHQCEYSDITDHGYDCVDVEKGYCEVGLDCIDECNYSYCKNEENKVLNIFKEAHPIED